MIHIHFIVGPTATGKSALAFEMARELDADILSADSRQVYKGLEIISGADIPADFNAAIRHPELDSGSVSLSHFQSKSGTNLFGLAFLNPNEEWSIAHFRQLADTCLKNTLKQHFIVVGGSGLYLQSLFLDKDQLHIPPSPQLRLELEQMSVQEIQQKILDESQEYRALFNDSDWHNPRRLIRFLEKKQFTTLDTNESRKKNVFSNPETHEWIGLTAEKEILLERITQRVKKRIEDGAIHEAEHFFSQHEDPHIPAASSLGLKEIRLFLNDQLTMDELIELWAKHEFQYAKRQMTWFKKKKYIEWNEVA